MYHPVNLVSGDLAVYQKQHILRLTGFQRVLKLKCLICPTKVLTVHYDLYEEFLKPHHPVSRVYHNDEGSVVETIEIEVDAETGTFLLILLYLRHIELHSKWFTHHNTLNRLTLLKPTTLLRLRELADAYQWPWMSAVINDASKPPSLAEGVLYITNDQVWCLATHRNTVAVGLPTAHVAFATSANGKTWYCLSHHCKTTLQVWRKEYDRNEWSMLTSLLDDEGKNSNIFTITTVGQTRLYVLKNQNRLWCYDLERGGWELISGLEPSLNYHMLDRKDDSLPVVLLTGWDVWTCGDDDKGRNIIQQLSLYHPKKEAITWANGFTVNGAVYAQAKNHSVWTYVAGEWQPCQSPETLMTKQTTPFWDPAREEIVWMGVTLNGDELITENGNFNIDVNNFNDVNRSMFDVYDHLGRILPGVKGGLESLEGAQIGYDDDGELVIKTHSDKVISQPLENMLFYINWCNDIYMMKKSKVSFENGGIKCVINKHPVTNTRQFKIYSQNPQSVCFVFENNFRALYQRLRHTVFYLAGIGSIHHKDCQTHYKTDHNQWFVCKKDKVLKLLRE
ncbi:protein ORF82 [Lake sturgeon herpesvirus]|nr:protein ORF82 [Lake sturgeon herpesvirus]